MRRRRLILAALVVILPVGAGPVRAADATDPAPPLVLTLTALEPRAPSAADEIVLSGTIRNLGETAIRSARVRLRVSSEPVGSRSALAAQAGSPASFGSLVNAPGAARDLPEVPAGGQATFTVRAPMATLRLPRFGVYAFGVDLRGDGGDGLATLGRLRTWIPYGKPAAPAGRGLQPTSIAWLWPLVDVPNRHPDGTFPDDALAASIRPDGRLGRLLGAAATAGGPGPRAGGSRLTFAVDPALLEALAAMAEGYSVRATGGARPTRGTGGPAAAAFLRRLGQLTAANPVLALPYADPDLAALVRAGRVADVGIATGSPTFRQIVQRVLGKAPLERIAWPPDGLAPQAAIDALSGVDTVVLSGTALPALPALSYTPGAAATLPALGGGTVAALVSDPTLDGLVAADPVQSGGVRQAEQRFLAETLLITVEQPSVSRSVLVAPPRRWAPSSAWASALLQESRQVPWLRPASLTDLRATSGPRSRGPLAYPAAAQQAELPGSVFTASGGIRSISTDLNLFRSILTNPVAAGVPALDRALLRCESSAWRVDPAAGRALRKATREALTASVAKVRITTSGTVSLASKKSTIPISVANGLNQPVRIQVAVDSRAAQLIAEDTGVQVIAGGHQIQLSVGLQAPGSGVFPITASLQTPEGQPYGVPVDLRVYSSRYGTLALAITAGAFAVLAGIAGVRLGRRLFAGRPPEPAG